jgi:putative hemolysin
MIIASILLFVTILIYSALRASLASSLRLRLELESLNTGMTGRAAALFIKEPTRATLSVKTGRSFFTILWVLSLCCLLLPAYSFISFSYGAAVFCLLVSIALWLLADAAIGSLTRMHPYTVLRLMAPFFLISYIIFWPVSSLLFRMRTHILSRSAQGADAKKESGSEDFEELVSSLYKDKGGEDPAQEPEVQILQNALAFQDVKAGACMIPRSEVVAMEINCSVNDLIRKFTSTRLTRILIYRESIENIVGYVHSFELFRKPVSVISVIRPVVVVPETVGVQEVLTLFIKQRRNIAVVVDEYGGTSGILTMEDVIEELFGEIDDEHDNDQLLEKKLNEKEYLFSGRLEISYLNEKYNFRLPESKDFTTLGGLVVHLGEGLPRPKQKLFSGHFRLEVVEVNNSKLETVKLILK